MSKIIDFARAKVGKPYVFGRSGPDSFDCSGLTKRAVAQIGLDWYHGATTQWLRGHQTGRTDQYGYWAASGKINTRPTNQLLFLFNQDTTKTSLVMAHTGIFDPVSGTVIQAGGFGGRGVHENPPAWNRWSHWATLKNADEETEMPTGLRIGSSGEAVRVVQSELIKLGHDLGKWGADGKYGNATAKAVREFQEATGLEVTGVWGELEEERLDIILENEANDVPVVGDQPIPINRAALLDELDGLNKRIAVIVAALKAAG